jgi:hypothetical protein
MADVNIAVGEDNRVSRQVQFPSPGRIHLCSPSFTPDRDGLYTVRQELGKQIALQSLRSTDPGTNVASAPRENGLHPPTKSTRPSRSGLTLLLFVFLESRIT